MRILILESDVLMNHDLVFSNLGMVSAEEFYFLTLV